MNSTVTVPPAPRPIPFSLPRGSVWPDFADKGLFGLSRSLHQWLQGAPLCPLPHQPDLSPHTLILFLVDGLGDTFLNRFGMESQLLAHRQTRLTSVCPSTTASAITTLATGLAPVSHGLTGWVIRDRRFGGNLMPLPLRRPAGRFLRQPFAIERLFPYAAPVSNEKKARAIKVLLPPKIVGTPFSARHLRHETGPLDTENLASQILDEARKINAAGGGLLYVYYTTFDAVSHESGPWSDAALECFQRVDSVFQAVVPHLRAIKADMLVTADHGFTRAFREKCWRLDRRTVKSMLKHAPSGEARLTYCHVRAGAENDFTALANETMKGKAIVVPSWNLVRAGLFGPGTPHRRLKERIGTHTLLMESGWTTSFRYPGEHRHFMRGVHGGLSSDEMWVPLIHAR